MPLPYDFASFSSHFNAVPTKSTDTIALPAFAPVPGSVTGTSLASSSSGMAHLIRAPAPRRQVDLFEPADPHSHFHAPNIPGRRAGASSNCLFCAVSRANTPSPGPAAASPPAVSAVTAYRTRAAVSPGVYIYKDENKMTRRHSWIVGGRPVEMSVSSCPIAGEERMAKGMSMEERLEEGPEMAMSFGDEPARLLGEQ
jgi:hypothetical protein